MTDVMIDLETLGKDAGCVVLSIGAVTFDRKRSVSNNFYRVISLDSSTNAGLVIDKSTLEWWEDQSEEARQVLTASKSPIANMQLREALIDFSDYLETVCPDKNSLELWSFGAAFDQPILNALYKNVGIECPWKYRASRCFRTLCAEYPNNRWKIHGTYHNALDDAITQAQHANLLFRLKNSPSLATRIKTFVRGS